MTLPIPIADRLVKLVPLLGSDKDGEVIAAAHAIRRTLRSAGRDLHDLAFQLARDATRHELADDWRLHLRFCLARAAHLSPKEQRFLGNLAGWRGQRSPKQLEWLASIEGKLRGHQ